MDATCPKCNSTNLSSRSFYLNNTTNEKTILAAGKKDSSIIAFFVLLFGLGLLSVSLFTLPMLFSDGSSSGTILIGIIGGAALVWYGAKTLRLNILLSKQSLMLEHTCKYCNHIWQEQSVSRNKPVYLTLLPIGAGFFSCIMTASVAMQLDPNLLMIMLVIGLALSIVVFYITKQLLQKNHAVSQVAVQSPLQTPLQIPQALEQPATAQTISPEDKKVDESKLCPRCYTESDTLFICKQCGYVNKTIGGALFILALIGLAIGTHGLLAWMAAKNPLWVEIGKTLLCGLPGMLLVYGGVTEIVHITKSRQWTQRHNYDMNELINFYKKNPNASMDEAGKFFNRTGQWVQLMLSESESKKE